MKDAIHRSSITWLAIFAIVVVMFLKLPPMVARQDALLTTYRALVEVDALAKKSYVEPIAPRQLVEGALRGMMLELDPYSGYIPADRLDALLRHASGEFTGVGVEVGLRDGRPIVIAPLEGSPAAVAGILPGDQILSIDGQPTDEMSVFEIDGLLNGRSDGHAQIEVGRRDLREHLKIELDASHGTLPSVRGFSRSAVGGWNYFLDDQKLVGYIRISTFLATTVDDFDTALASTLEGGAKGLILDLRFNPGGLTEPGVAVVDRFVSAGVILSTVSRLQAIKEYAATADTAAPDVPLVVLINGSSASSAEIVAGALQDFGRATIVGSRSFGKGSVQHLIRLKSIDAAIKLTVAKYRLPSGRIIHRTEGNADSDSWGIIPDELIRLTDEETAAIRDARRAIDLAFLGMPETAEASAHSPKASPNTTKSVLLDRQLEKARDVLVRRIDSQN